MAFRIMSAQEFKEQCVALSGYDEILNSLQSIRYCKAENYNDCILGTIRLPQKNENNEEKMSFAFYLTGESLILVEKDNKLKLWFEKHKGMLVEEGSSEQILLRIIECMTSEDTMFLSHLETEVENMEPTDANFHYETEDVFITLMRHRRKLAEFNIYYEQLRNIGELFADGFFDGIVEENERWDRFTRRIERLQNHVFLLRENMLQLSELYQSMQDARQNRIMSIITMITSLFMPLTLITGWYGMNFVNMPELHWRYGYIAVIIVAVVIVISEFIYFRKKKIL